MSLYDYLLDAYGYNEPFFSSEIDKLDFTPNILICSSITTVSPHVTIINNFVYNVNKFV